MGVTNIIWNALRPGYLRVMLDKVLKRIKEPNATKVKSRAKTWCESIALTSDAYMKKIHPELYAEAVIFNEKLHLDSDEIISKLPFKMGGGANCTLIYFLTKYFKPQVVIETGVSMGFSSYTFLKILNEYGGVLYSSDFPYFRHANPEKYVGCLVPEEWRKNWNLYLKGDRANFAEILHEIEKVDLFHFDSDKSYEGRQFAFEKVLPFLTSESIVVFDDIDDNLHFKDLVEIHNYEFKVIKDLRGGFTGIIYNFK